MGLSPHGGGLGTRFWVCSRNSVKSVEFGSGGVQVEGFQYVGRLVVRGWFLKWNCFFMIWVTRFDDFKTRWCVKVRGVGTNLRPQTNTLV